MSNIRRLLLVLALLAPAASAQYFPYNGQCSKGGQEVLVQNQPSKGTVPIGGTVRSLTSGVIGSYPGCTVTVFLTGTQTPATIFSDNHGTVLANPFTANTDGSYLLFSTQGGYDIAMSGAGLPATVTLTGIQLGGGGSGPPGSLSVSTNGVTNGSQTLLNFANGANMSIVDNGQGTDTFSVVGVITGATSNSGLIQTGSTLGLYPCPNGQILKSIGTNWACSAFLSGPTLQINGVNNALQNLLNLQAGAGVTITDNGSGSAIFSAGSGFTGSGTPNFLTKFTSPFGLGNSAISEASPTSPAIDPNGYDAGTTGAFSNDIPNSALGGGTVLNALACNDGTGKEQVCPAVSSTTNLPDGTCIGNCGTTGNGIIAYLGIILIGFDNQSVPGDWAVESTTLNGYLHDTGLTSQTPGQPNFYVWSANAGPNTAGQYRRLTPSEIAAASTSISFTVNGGAPLGSPVNCVNGIGTTCLNASGNNFEVDVAPIPQAVTVTADPTPGLSNNGEFYQLNYSGAGNFTLPASIPAAQWSVVASNISSSTVTIQGNGNNVCSLACAGTLTIPAYTQFYVASSSGQYVASIAQVPIGNIGSAGLSGTSPIVVAATGAISCPTCGTGTGTVSSVGLNINGGTSSGLFAVSGSPVTGSGTLNYNLTGTSGGVPYFSSSSIMSAGGILNSNILTKGGGAGAAPTNSQITDDGSTAAQSPNGFDYSTAGPALLTKVNDTGTGTAANLFACKSATAGSVVKCPTSTVTGVQGVAVAGHGTAPGTTGSTSLCWGATCSVKTDNTTTIGHYGIPSTTVAGEIHDTGNTTPTANTDSFYITSVGTAGNPVTIEIGTPDWYAAQAAAKVYTLEVNGTALTAGDTVNLNATTPAAPSNGYAVTLATSKSGTTDSVSGAVVGDGTSTHFLNGTGVFSTPAGGGGGNCNGGAAQCVYLKNNASGTTNGLVSKWVSQSADAGNVGTTTVGDGTVGNSVPVAGIVVSGGGTTGFAQVAISGTVPCTFDGTTETQGDQVYLSTTAGKCHDPGAASTPANENPNIHYQIGIVDATVTGNATANVDLTPASLFGGISGFVANANYFTFMGANSYAGMQFQPMNLQQIGSTGLAASDLSITAAGGNVGLRFADGNNGNQFTRLVGCGNPVCGAANNDFMIDMLTGNSGNSPSLRVNGGFYVVQKTETFGGAGSLDASKGVQHSITLTGNSTISGMTNQNPAQEVMALICQNGTGGFTLTWGANFVNPPAMPAAASTCLSTDWFYDGTNYDFLGSPRPITVVKTSQAAAITTTTISTPQAAGMYKLTATLDCDSSSASATVNVTIGWTDPSNTAQSSSLGTAVLCTTLGSASVGSLELAFRIKANTNITYATNIVNTPTYDLSIALETMTQ